MNYSFNRDVHSSVSWLSCYSDVYYGALAAIFVWGAVGNMPLLCKALYVVAHLEADDDWAERLSQRQDYFGSILAE